MSNAYRELRKQQQAEFDKFPLGAAFNNEQFKEMMEKWGLKEKDTDKILSLGAGAFIRKADKEAYLEMNRRHTAQLKEAIAADETGEGFIYEMFYHELANHEYGYTGDLEDTLDALGYTAEEINADERLLRGLNKAADEIMNHDCFD